MLLIIIALIGFITVKDYGYSWDETFRFKGGDAKLKYYSDLFSGEPRKVHTSTYPGLFDLPLAALHQAFPELGTRSQKGHVWSLCFGLLGILSIWRAVARIGGERAGFWALLFMATFPRYYGHMLFNPKDIPLAGTYAFGVWALVELFARLPESRWRFVVWVGLAAGLTMSTRIAGFLLLVYFGLFVGLYLLYNYLRSRDMGALLRALLPWALRGAVAGLIGLAILLVFWPTIHNNPFEKAGESLETVQKFHWGGMVLMDGHFWEAQDLPIYYLPYWIFKTTPEHILLLASLGLLLAILKILGSLRRGQWIEPPLLFPATILVFSGIFPILYIIGMDTVLYDGLRHILFALAPLVGLAALTFEWILRKAEAYKPSYLALVVQVVTAISVLQVVLTMCALHPYQYVYFNRISGGLPAAFNSDETDYWGLTHKEAGEWLNHHIEEIDPDGERVYKVHQRYSRWMLKEALNPDRFELWQPREGADFFVSVTRFNLHTSYPNATLIHAVERQGVPLCYIFSFPKEVLE